MRPVPVRWVLAGLLLVALVVAGVASQYASSAPDGLERVAEDQGFAATAESSGDRPLADYRTPGVEDRRLSGGFAGVAGALLVLALAGGLTYVVRRRAADRERPDDRETAESR